MRALLVAFTVLTAAGFGSLFVMAERTAELFAWTIEPPLTAAFLGAGYGAGFVLSVLSLRAGDWRSVRVPFLTVLTFTWLTTAATYVHRDRLHIALPGEGRLAEPAAWVWIVVYVVIPVGMTAALVLQRRSAAPGGRVVPGQGDGAPAVPLPRALGLALALEGLLMLGAGTVLLLVPAAAEGVWPWALSPFTARVVAAWLLAFAVASALALRSGDLGALSISTVAYTAFGVLQLVAVLRFASDLGAARPLVVAYVALLCAVGATGAVGRLLAGRAR